MRHIGEEKKLLQLHFQLKGRVLMKMMRAGADLLVNGGGGKEHVELPIQRRSPLII